MLQRETAWQSIKTGWFQKRFPIFRERFPDRPRIRGDEDTYHSVPLPVRKRVKFMKTSIFLLILLIFAHDLWQQNQKREALKQAEVLTEKLGAIETQLSAAKAQSTSDKAAMEGAVKQLAEARGQIDQYKKMIDELKQQAAAAQAAAAQAAAQTALAQNSVPQGDRASKLSKEAVNSASPSDKAEAEALLSSSPEDLIGTWTVLSSAYSSSSPAHLFEFHGDGTVFDIRQSSNGTGGQTISRTSKTWLLENGKIHIFHKNGSLRNPHMEISLPFNKNRLEICELISSGNTLRTVQVFATKTVSGQEESMLRPLKQPPIKLMPQINYLSTLSADRVATLELYDAIKPFSEIDSSLEIVDFPEIINGVTLMMPLKDAIKALGLTKQIPPPPSPISYPGIPFNFRPFQNKRDSDGKPIELAATTDFSREGGAIFNLIYIITDNADRVVGIEFVCETPKSPTYSNNDLLSYNFVLNRRKAASNLGVRRDISRPTQDLLIIGTWLADRRERRGLEIVQWYVPIRIANFMRYVIKTRLKLPE